MRLAHVAARHDAAREPAGLLRLRAGLERLGLGADGGDLDAVGEALGQAHPGESRR